MEVALKLKLKRRSVTPHRDVPLEEGLLRRGSDDLLRLGVHADELGVLEPGEHDAQQREDLGGERPDPIVLRLLDGDREAGLEAGRFLRSPGILRVTLTVSGAENMELGRLGCQCHGGKIITGTIHA